jgi:hypothetical protein
VTPQPLPPNCPILRQKVIGPNWQLEGERWGGGGGGKGRFLERYPPNIHSLAKQGLFRGEAAFMIQAFPWETEFMNIALWSPRGAQARERTRMAGTTVLLVLLQETGADTCSIRVHGVVPDDSASWRCRLRYATPSAIASFTKTINVRLPNWTNMQIKSAGKICLSCCRIFLIFPRVNDKNPELRKCIRRRK